ncbi:MAG: NAD(P)H-dependent oxidoreductase [Sediminibacterium sp.]|nr:NAD(P)H-dependent oxidoreductase [Sediminibacterium sp.]
MKQNILIINAHPNTDSFNTELAKAYKAGALLAGAQVKEIVIAELAFDPNLQYGYAQRMEWEPDLKTAWDNIQWAHHLVWVHPVWWGGLPAIAKGFIDRVFLPGLAFKFEQGKVFWKKLLSGKSAHIITTLDQPGWFYSLAFGKPSVNQLKRSTLQFCGVKPVRVSYIGSVKGADETKRKRWLEQVTQMGRHLR